jgi:hypothetical protein
MAEFNKHSFILLGSTALVVVSLVLSLMTWIVYAAAYVGKLGDAAELPLVLITFGTPLVALPGLVFTIKTIELRPSKTWRAYSAAAIVSSISAIVAVVVFYVFI